jgi:hypothetical protein
MDKTHYKELIEKYFEETITDVEIKELSDWIKNDRQLHDWWEQEFERSDSSMNPVLRDKLFARIKDFGQGSAPPPYHPLEMGCCYFITCLCRFLHLLSFRFFSNGRNTLYCESGQRR